MRRNDWLEGKPAGASTLNLTICSECGDFNDMRAGNVHMHGHRIQVPEFEMVANPTVRYVDMVRRRL